MSLYYSEINNKSFQTHLDLLEIEFDKWIEQRESVSLRTDIVGISHSKVIDQVKYKDPSVTISMVVCYKTD